MKLCTSDNCFKEATHRLSTRFCLCKHHYIQECNAKNRAKFSKANVKVRKPTGEAAMFLDIWKNRPHVSEVSGLPLGDEMKAHYFAHILPKSTFGKWRLNKKNICLMTMEEHSAFDTKGKEQALRLHPNLARIYDLAAKMKVEYSVEILRQT